MFSMSRSSNIPSYTNFKGNIKVSSLTYVSTMSLAGLNPKPNFFIKHITRTLAVISPVIHTVGSLISFGFLVSLLPVIKTDKNASIAGSLENVCCYYTNSYCIIRLYQKYNQQNWIHS